MSRRHLAWIAVATVAGILLAAAIGAVALLDGPAVKSAIAAQASLALGEPVTIGSARLSLVPRPRLVLHDVTVGTGGRIRAGRIEIAAGLGALLRKRIEDAELRVLDALISFDVSGAIRATTSASPASPASPAAAATATAPTFAIASVSTIEFRRLEVRAGGKSASFSLVGAVDGDHATITELSARWPKSAITATANLTSWGRRAGTFQLDATHLDLDEILDFVAALSPPREPAGKRARATPVLAESLTGELRARDGSLRGVPFRNLTAKPRVRGAVAALEDIHLGLCDGTYEGAVGLELTAGAPRIKYQGTLQAIDLSQLGRVLAWQSKPGGRLKASIEVRGSGDSVDRALASASGAGEVRIDEGRLAGLDLTHKILAALGAAAAGGTSEAPFQLSAPAVLGQGRMRSSSIRLQSPDFDAEGSGSIGLDGSLDVRAELLLSPALSAKVPSAGGLEVRRDGRLAVPIHIGGNAMAPSVAVDTTALAKGVAAGTALKVKGSLLKRIFGR